MNQYAECNGGEVDQLAVVIETWNLWEELMTPKVSDEWSIYPVLGKGSGKI